MTKKTAAKKTALTKPSTVQFVVYRELSVPEGEAVIAKFAEKVKAIFNANAGLSDNPAQYHQAVRQTTLDYCGEKLIMNPRLARMCVTQKFEACAGCGAPVSGYAIMESRDAIGKDEPQLRLIPMIGLKFATCDHIMPSGLGGRDSVSNMQIMCGTCNSSKRHMLDAADLAKLATNFLDMVNPNKLYAAARATTKKYRSLVNKKKAGQKINGGLVTAHAVNVALEEVKNVRNVITVAMKNGVSMVELRQAELAGSIQAINLNKIAQANALKIIAEQENANV